MIKAGRWTIEATRGTRWTTLHEQIDGKRQALRLAETAANEGQYLMIRISDTTNSPDKYITIQPSLGARHERALRYATQGLDTETRFPDIGLAPEMRCTLFLVSLCVALMIRAFLSLSTPLPF